MTEYPLTNIDRDETIQCRSSSSALAWALSNTSTRLASGTDARARAWRSVCIPWHTFSGSPLTASAARIISYAYCLPNPHFFSQYSAIDKDDREREQAFEAVGRWMNENCGTRTKRFDCRVELPALHEHLRVAIHRHPKSERERTCSVIAHWCGSGELLDDKPIAPAEVLIRASQYITGQEAQKNAAT